MKLKQYFYVTSFYDTKNNQVFFSHYTKEAYLILRENQRIFALFNNKGLISLATFLILYTLHINIYATFLISLFIYTTMSTYFYQQILPNLITLNDFDLKAAQYTLTAKNKLQVYSLIIAYLLSAAIIIILAILDSKLTIIIISITFSLYALYNIIQLILLYHKLKSQR